MTVLRNGAPRNRFLEEAQNSLKVIAGGRTTARINSAKVNFCFILFSLSFFFVCFAKQVHGRTTWCVQGRVIGRLEIGHDQARNHCFSKHLCSGHVFGTLCSPFFQLQRFQSAHESPFNIETKMDWSMLREQPTREKRNSQRSIFQVRFFCNLVREEKGIKSEKKKELKA